TCASQAGAPLPQSARLPFLHHPATPEIYTLPLHDALPISPAPTPPVGTDPETRALLQALREELAHVAQRVDARLLEVLETVRAERPLEVDAKVFGTLRGKVGRPKA